MGGRLKEVLQNGMMPRGNFGQVRINISNTPITFGAFEEYCEGPTSLSSESIHFLRDLTNLQESVTKLDFDKEKFYAELEAFYNKYIAQGAPEEVNISSDLRNQVKEGISQRGDPEKLLDFLEPTAAEIFKLLQQDPWKRFATTPGYNSFVKNELYPDMKKIFETGVVFNQVNIFSLEDNQDAAKQDEAYKAVDAEAPQNEMLFLTNLYYLYLEKEKGNEPGFEALRQIYDDYITPGAPHKVEVSDSVAAKIQAAFENPQPGSSSPSLELFARATNEIMFSIQKDTIPKVQNKQENELRDKQEKELRAKKTADKLKQMTGANAEAREAQNVLASEKQVFQKTAQDPVTPKDKHKTFADTALQAEIDNQEAQKAGDINAFKNFRSDKVKQLTGVNTAQKESTATPVLPSPKQVHKLEDTFKKELEIPVDLLENKIENVNIFGDSRMFNVLKEFCKTEFSDENVDFLQALHDLYTEKEEPTPKKLMEIYDTYVKEGAKRQVNLPAAERKALDAIFKDKKGKQLTERQLEIKLGMIAKSPREKMELFAGSAHHIFLLLKGDTGPRFIKSEIYLKEKEESSRTIGDKISMALTRIGTLLGLVSKQETPSNTAPAAAPPQLTVNTAVAENATALSNKFKEVEVQHASGKKMDPLESETTPVITPQRTLEAQKSEGQPAPSSARQLSAGPPQESTSPLVEKLNELPEQTRARRGGAEPESTSPKVENVSAEELEQELNNTPPRPRGRSLR